MYIFFIKCNVSCVALLEKYYLFVTTITFKPDATLDRVRSHKTVSYYHLPGYCRDLRLTHKAEFTTRCVAPCKKVELFKLFVPCSRIWLSILLPT